MADQKELKKRLKALMGLPENQVCSDCTERQPRWASLIVPPPGAPEGSLPMGAFCCLECSGSHRRLGVHISFVRSINLDSWKEREVLAMENGGNAKVNAIFEAHLNREKPTNHADLQTRERFIRDKYERRKFYNPAAFDTAVASAGGRSAPPPTSAAVQQPQEISLPALRPAPVGPPSDVAQRRIQERRRRNQGGSPNKDEKPLRRVGSGEKKKPSVSPSSASSSSTPRKSKAPSTGLVTSSSIDLLDFNDEPATTTAPPAPPARAADLFGFLAEDKSSAGKQNDMDPRDAFGSGFFKEESAPTAKNAAADIMALYGNTGGSGSHNHHPNNINNMSALGQQSFYGNGNHPMNNSNTNGSIHAMTAQMARMDFNPSSSQPQMMMQQQQQQQHQQMMMMQQQKQQQQQMLMMMHHQQQQQQQQRTGPGFGVPNTNNNMMNMMMMNNSNNNGRMAMAAHGNVASGVGHGAAMGGRLPAEKEDPFASLGGRNTFR